MDLDAVLKHAFEKDASDIHLVAGQPPMMRVHQVIAAMPFPNLTPEDCRGFVTKMAPKGSVEIFDRNQDADFSYELAGIARYRVTRTCSAARSASRCERSRARSRPWRS